MIRSGLILCGALTLTACGHPGGDNTQSSARQEGSGDPKAAADTSGQVADLVGQGDQMPADMPLGLPAFPGSSILSNMDIPVDAGAAKMINANAPDAAGADKVVAFYRDFAKAHGLTVVQDKAEGVIYTLSTKTDAPAGGFSLVMHTDGPPERLHAERARSQKKLSLAAFVARFRCRHAAAHGRIAAFRVEGIA